MKSKREELEAALAEAEASREQLEVKLAEAKDALVNTVTDASKIDAKRDEAAAKVERARERCRRLRAALADPSQVEFITRSRERLSTIIEQPEGSLQEETSAKPSSVQPRNPAPCARNESPKAESSRQKGFRQIGNALATSGHAREAIGLLALTLAYLQYYFLDVGLQIVELRSVIVIPLH